MKKMFDRMNKRNMIFGLAALAVIAVMVAFSGGLAMIGGLGLAMALPSLTDKEEAFLSMVKDEVTKAHDKFEKNYITETKLKESVEASINKYLEGGVTIEQFNKLNKALEDQGLLITKMQGSGNEQPKSFKDVFTKAFAAEGLTEKLAKASQGGAPVEIIKAVGTVTTGSVTTDTGGNALLDMINADELNSMRLRDQFIENFCTVTRTSKPVYTYVDYVPKEGDVTFVLEGGTKTEIDLKAEVRTITPSKAAGWTKLTEEAATDVPRMESEARVNIFKKYLLRRQNGILFGDGIAPNPTGVTTVAPAFSAGTWTGGTKTAPNLYDAMVAIKNQIELAANYTDDVDYYPNVVFLNPANYNGLLIEQSDQVYTFNTVNGAKVMNIDGIQVVPKKEIPTGKILMGDFTKLEVINYIDYMAKVGYVNDDFIKNEFVMLGEGRFYVLVRELDKLAFVYDDISTVITALTTV